MNEEYQKDQLVVAELGTNNSHFGVRYGFNLPSLNVGIGHWPYILNNIKFVFKIQEVDIYIKLKIPFGKIQLFHNESYLKIDGYGSEENCHVFINRNKISPFKGKLCNRCGYGCSQKCIDGTFKIGE
jgi:hypothetical protein